MDESGKGCVSKEWSKERQAGTKNEERETGEEDLNGSSHWATTTTTNPINAFCAPFLFIIATWRKAVSLRST